MKRRHLLPSVFFIFALRERHDDVLEFCFVSVAPKIPSPRPIGFSVLMPQSMVPLHDPPTRKRQCLVRTSLVALIALSSLTYTQEALDSLLLSEWFIMDACRLVETIF